MSLVLYGYDTKGDDPTKVKSVMVGCSGGRAEGGLGDGDDGARAGHDSNFLEVSEFEIVLSC